MSDQRRIDRKPLLAIIAENMTAIKNYGSFKDHFADNSLDRITIHQWFGNYEKIPDLITIDARSEAEYAADHLPGAINFPILDNRERDEVGFLYKQVSAEAAYFWAEKIADRKKDLLLQLAALYAGRQVAVYCWRGGGRSTALAFYLQKYGLPCVKISGGYKSYRNHVHQLFYQNGAQNLSFLVLTGLTGCGKTQIIEHLESKVPTLDIESAACHASSLFGHVRYLQNKTITSQTEFESRLFAQLLNHRGQPLLPYLTEGESKAVSTFQIPDSLYKKLKESPAVKINAPLESRIARIRAEYFGDDRTVQIMETLNSSRFFKMLLGADEIQRLSSLLENERIDEFCEYFLVSYYDKRYAGLYSNIIAEVENVNPVLAAGQIEEIMLKIAKTR